MPKPLRPVTLSSKESKLSDREIAIRMARASAILDRIARRLAQKERLTIVCPRTDRPTILQ